MNYVGLEQQGFWKPFEYLGAALAGARDRRDRLNQLAKENARADTRTKNEDLGAGLERDVKGTELDILKRKKALSEFNPGSEITAFRPPEPIGEQPSVDLGTNPNGTLDLSGANAALDAQGAAPVGPRVATPIAPDFSKPFHEQPDEVKQAYQKFASSKRFTLPEVVAAHNSAFTATTGKPVIPQIDLKANPLLNGMTPYSATVGPGGEAQVNVLNPQNIQQGSGDEGQVIYGQNKEPILKMLTTIDPKTGLPVRTWHNVEGGNFKQLSEDGAKEMEAYPTILNRLEHLQNSYNKLSTKFFGTGPVGGRIGNWSGKNHFAPSPEYKEFEQNLHLLQDLVPKTLSGNTGKMAQGEIDRYLDTLPKNMMSKEVTERMLTNVAKTVIDSYKLKRSTLGQAGYRVGGFPETLEAPKMFQPDASAPSSAPASVSGPGPTAGTPGAIQFQSVAEAQAGMAQLAPGTVFEVLDPQTGKFQQFRKD